MDGYLGRVVVKDSQVGVSSPSALPQTWHCQVLDIWLNGREVKQRGIESGVVISPGQLQKGPRQTGWLGCGGGTTLLVWSKRMETIWLPNTC